MMLLFSVPPRPSLSIISTGPSTAGLAHNLTCSVMVVSGLTAGPTLVWNGHGVGQVGVKSSSEATSNALSLTFSPLHTSHGGFYTCTARLTIPEAGVNVTRSNTTSVVVLSVLHQLTLSLCA